MVSASDISSGRTYRRYASEDQRPKRWMMADEMPRKARWVAAPALKEKPTVPEVST